LKEFTNLVVTRTFSKIYALAGARIGFAIAHSDVADLMNRVRQPFNVSSIGLEGALAALNDNEFIQKSYALNRTGMLQLTDGYRKLNIELPPRW
jgi:histidinol-phosphate aminotransferase